MSKFHNDTLDKVLAILLDLLAKKSFELSFQQKRKIANLLTRLVLPFKFCRKEYVIDRIQKSMRLSYSEAEKLMKDSLEAFILNSIEMSSIRYMSDNDIKDKIRVEGIEYVDEALKLGKGVVMVSGHFGLWEYIPQWLSVNGYKMTSVVRVQSNKYVDEWFTQMRQAHGALVTDSGYGLRDILRSLRNGHILGLMMDQDNGKQGIFIRFMDKWASSPTGPAAISLKTGSPVLPIYVFPDYKGKHLLKVYPPIYVDKYEKSLEGQQKLTQDYNNLHEQIVKKYPEQWFWLHKRWKTQPVDCPDNPWVKLMNINESKDK